MRVLKIGIKSNSSVTYIKIKTAGMVLLVVMVGVLRKKIYMINHLIRNIVDFELICIKQCSY